VTPELWKDVEMSRVSKHFPVLAAALVLALADHGAHAHAVHRARNHVAPAAHRRAYRAYDAYDAYGRRGVRAEEFYGTSVPYDPDGPGYNDFQLQGTN
jgi:hypothetical protein